MRLAYKPFPEDRGRVLYFEGQPRGQFRPDMHEANLESVELRGLTIPVDDRGIFETPEVTALALAGLGASNSQINKRIRVGKAWVPRPASTVYSPVYLYDAYGLLGVSADSWTARYHATGLSFRRGVFSADPDADKKADALLARLPKLLEPRFLFLAPLMAEGLSFREIGELMDMPPRTLDNWTLDIRKCLHVNSVGMVMLAGALGLMPKDEEPTVVTAENGYGWGACGFCGAAGDCGC